MKDLKTYISEAIKPPRLSAKNRELWMPKHLDEKEVMNWLEKNCIIRGKVEIVDDKINVNGDVFFKEKIEEFLYPFGEVTGCFDCKDCEKLKSLKNSPQKVGDYFSCSYCKNLTSLEGAPQTVGGSFSCFGCGNLTSLKGAPKKVGNDFDCWDCGKEFTEEDFRRVCKVKGMIHNT